MSTSSFVHVNRPVTKNENFIGREEIMNYITRGIKYNESIYYAIVGELGMGKTSILNNLRFSETYKKYNLPDNILFVMVDPLDRVTCGEDFYRDIGESIINAIQHSSSISVSEELVEYIEESVNQMYQYKHKRQIERALTRLFQEFFNHNLKIVLMLDDFEKTVEKSNLDYSEFNYLRTLTSGINVNVSYIITSRKDLKFISDAANLSGFSYIFKSSIPYSPTFTEEETFAYIDQNLSDFALLEKDKKGIALLSGGVPNLLRAICSRVLQQLNEENTLVVNQLAKAVLSEENAYLENLVKKNEEDLVNILSKNTDAYERSFSIKRLSTIGLLKNHKEPIEYTSPIFELCIEDWWKRQSVQVELDVAEEEEVLEVKKEQLFVHVNQSVTNSDYFVGRDEIMKYITNGIKHNNSVYYALIGELGMGKTSILNNLCFKETHRKYNLPDSILFVMVDPLDRASCGEDFYRYIGESIQDAMTKKENVPIELIDFINESVNNMYSYKHKKQIERTLTALLQEVFAHHIKIILLLDDFEKTVQTSNLDYPEFNYMRTLTNAINVNVSYIITSRKDLKFISEAANLSGFSYIFKSTIPFRPTLNDEEVGNYMNKYLAPLRMAEKELDEIAELSGGVPTLLRAICSKLLQDKENGKKLEIDRLSKEIIKENKAYLESVVEKNEEDFRHILLNENPDPHERKISLKRLSTIGVLKDGAEDISFTSPLFDLYLKSWVKRQMGEPDELEEDVPNSTIPVISDGGALAEGQGAILIDALNGIPTNTLSEPFSPEVMWNLFLKIIEYIRITSKEDTERIFGEKMDDMEQRLNIRLNEMTQNIREYMKQNFSDLKQLYLAPGNEDISVYASKIREQASFLLQNDQYVAYSKEIAIELDHIWVGLEQESREYIMIGELLQYIFDEQKMDLSPVSICYCRAFELELNRKMLPFLKVQVPQFAIQVGPKQIPLEDPAVKHLMLGGYLKVYSGEKKRIKSAMQDRGIDSSKFMSSFDKMTKIRNRTAHAERIDVHDIESLKGYLFGSEQIQGMMKSLQMI